MNEKKRRKEKIPLPSYNLSSNKLFLVKESMVTYKNPLKDFIKKFGDNFVIATYYNQFELEERQTIQNFLRLGT